MRAERGFCRSGPRSAIRLEHQGLASHSSRSDAPLNRSLTTLQGPGLRSQGVYHMTRYVGIDLHKHLIVGHVVDAAGKKADTFRYESVDAATLDHSARKRLKPGGRVG